MTEKTRSEIGSADREKTIGLSKWVSYRLSRIGSAFGKPEKQVAMLLLSQPFVIHPMWAIDAYKKLLEEGKIKSNTIE